MAYNLQLFSMDKKKPGIERNTPAEKGKNDDPNLRDHSGIQPGASTVSRSDSDYINENKSETASENFREDEFGKDADRSFDEIEKEE
jgi:hypothetical protein